jgi:hypothetical protein
VRRNAANLQRAHRRAPAELQATVENRIRGAIFLRQNLGASFAKFL